LRQKIRGMLAGYAYYLSHRHLPADPIAATTIGKNNGRA
jgi:hypothetical protein